MSATASAIQGPGVASALRASRSSSRNNASGSASTTTKYFAHNARPIASAEQQPVQHASAPQRGVEGVAGERPERQLDDVVIELGRGVLEVMQAIDDQHGDERADAGRPAATRGQPDQREGGDHRDLRQRVVRGVDPEHPIERSRSATTAAAAACHSRTAIRGHRSEPRSDRAADWDKAASAAAVQTARNAEPRNRAKAACGWRSMVAINPGIDAATCLRLAPKVAGDVIAANECFATAGCWASAAWPLHARHPGEIGRCRGARTREITCASASRRVIEAGFGRSSRCRRATTEPRSCPMSVSSPPFTSHFATLRRTTTSCSATSGASSTTGCSRARTPARRSRASADRAAPWS